MADAELLRQRHRCFVESGARLIARRGDGGVDAERQGDQRVPEQKALHFRERQDALDLSVGFCVEEGRAMRERALDYGLPARAVEEGGLRAGGNELVPPGGLCGLKLLHLQVSGLRGSHRYATIPPASILPDELLTPLGEPDRSAAGGSRHLSLRRGRARERAGQS